jgi:TAT-translocated FGD2 family F420-dependent dehydrogenase
VSAFFVGYHCAAEQFSPAELVELAVAAEAAGFQGVTMSDHLHPWQDNQGHAGHAWMMLAAIAARTERLIVGTGITCPIYRHHPLEVAHAFASLGVLFPGRVFLGVGTGEAVNEAPAGGWGTYRERSARLVEAVRLIRRLWTGEWVDFDGQYYQLRGAKLYDLPPAPVPIYVAASGVRSVRIAAREGDGWITDHGTLRRGEAAKQSFAEEARAAGKDPAALPRITELWAVVGERDEALAAARLWQFLPVFPDVVNLPDPRAVQRRAEELSSPERVVAEWVVSRDPDVHVAAVRELAGAGATHIFLHSPQPDQRRVIEFYRRHVLPALR